jgi:hypothetical protein
MISAPPTARLILQPKSANRTRYHVIGPVPKINGISEVFDILEQP